MTTFLRFRHLQERQIVTNWPQLKRLIEKQGFPPGRYLGPNTRAWTADEINDWLETRPIAGGDLNGKPVAQRDRTAAAEHTP